MCGGDGFSRGGEEGPFVFLMGGSIDLWRRRDDFDFTSCGA